MNFPIFDTSIQICYTGSGGLTVSFPHLLKIAVNVAESSSVQNPKNIILGLISVFSSHCGKESK